MKSRLRTAVILLCVAILFLAVVNRAHAGPRTTRPTAARRQQALVKQINQRAVRFYKAFVSESVRTTGLDCDLNYLLEDLLLAVDGLTSSRSIRHNLVLVMQIASDVEQELLLTDISPDVVTAWSRLHADLDRLAKMNGIKWNEPDITDVLIATLKSDVGTVHIARSVT